MFSKQKLLKPSKAFQIFPKNFHIKDQIRISSCKASHKDSFVKSLLLIQSMKLFKSLNTRKKLFKIQQTFRSKWIKFSIFLIFFSIFQCISSYVAAKKKYKLSKAYVYSTDRNLSFFFFFFFHFRKSFFIFFFFVETFSWAFFPFVMFLNFDWLKSSINIFSAQENSRKLFPKTLKIVDNSMNFRFSRIWWWRRRKSSFSFHYWTLSFFWIHESN